uniref:Mitochondrial dicarboxylate carrier n=1 Tax=Panagrolaimus superbus TaxID=310955 RepID=A0A914Y9H8_9BILA
MLQSNTDRVTRWYFGGLASAGAAFCTHPLDLMKVHLQTQQTGKITMPQMARKIFASDGILGFYNGLSASLLRQLTYSTTRFGMYEALKKQFPQDQVLPFYQKAALAGISGACGGVIGTPGDLVNVRMQNDIKLPPAQRRNYKHAIDGLFRITKEEGISKLFNGATMATSRAVLMTIGQLSFYDQFKQTIISSGMGGDNLSTHFSASIAAASIATLMTQPLDVLKTRMMNAKKNEFKGIADCFLYTAKTGPSSFFKGLLPAWVRLAPHTVLTFVFAEQLRMNFGYFK